MSNADLTGLIGHPVSHSWSPLLWNALYRSRAMHHLYVAIDLEPHDLGRFVLISRSSLLGFNVTAPYKRSVMEHLDSIDREAARIGSVNVVVARDHGLVGGNTDYSGFGNLLESHEFDLHSTRICIRGTGGSFRSVYAYIADHFGGVDISVISRTPGNFTAKDPLFANGPLPVFLDYYAAKDAKFDFLINCSPLGMLDERQLPFPIETLQNAEAGIDLIYNPAKTPFVKCMESLGKACANGLAMFAGQARESFERIHGFDPGKEAVDRILSGIDGGGSR